MQIFALYYSKEGNTRKLPERIGEGRVGFRSQGSIEIHRWVTKDDFLNSAGIIAGSPVYFGAMAWDLKRVFDEYIGIREKMESNMGTRLSPRPEMHQVEKRLQ